MTTATEPTHPAAEAAQAPAAKPSRRVVVCLNCGHIWEANQKTARPQCYDCKKTRTRAATPDEVILMDSGKTNIRADAEPQPAADIKAPVSEPIIDRKVDPLVLIDPAYVPPAPAPSISHTPMITTEPAAPERIEDTQPGISPWFFVIVIGGIITLIIGAMILFHRNQATHTQQEHTDDPPLMIPDDEPAQFLPRTSTLPGM